jgi:hypothetical protein
VVAGQAIFAARTELGRAFAAGELNIGVSAAIGAAARHMSQC